MPQHPLHVHIIGVRKWEDQRRDDHRTWIRILEEVGKGRHRREMNGEKNLDKAKAHKGL